MKRITIKKFYRRIADAAHDELRKIHDLTPEQLSELLEYANALSRTNCWWMEYQMKEIVLDHIRTSPKFRQVVLPATGEVI